MAAEGKQSDDAEYPHEIGIEECTPLCVTHFRRGQKARQDTEAVSGEDERAKALNNPV
jgi:hypothetical protein